MKFLVIGNEQYFATPLYASLRKITKEYECCSDYTLASYLLSNHVFDVILLNPTYSGAHEAVSFVQEIRRLSICTPLIVISELSDVATKVMFLNAGCDDYVEIPFAGEELHARIDAAYRRKNDYIYSDIVFFCDFSFDIRTYHISCGDHTEKLTSKEGKILEYLLLNKNYYKTKNEIYFKCWDLESNSNYNSVEVYISFLRKKITAIGSSAKIIVARNIGYRIVEK